MKKVVKILIVILVVAIILIVGRKIYYNNLTIEPNDLYLTKENSEISIKMNTGTYSWSDKGIQVVADSIPAQDMDNLKVLNVKPDEKIYFTDCDWTSSSAIILLRNENNVAGFAIDSNPKENYIIVPNIKGEYIVQISLESAKGEVWYAAKLNITE